MSVNEKMTAIANSIRNKTGKTDKLTLDQMPLEIDGIGIQSASGTYIPTTSEPSMWIDVSNIGFVPDLAVVILDDTDLEYTGNITKGCVHSYCPELLDFYAIPPEPMSGYDATTNMAVLLRGVKGTYNLPTVASTPSNCICKRNGDGKYCIRTARNDGNYPFLVGGEYKWFAYKIWG